MFAAIHQFLHDLRWLVLLVTLPTAIFYGWRFYGLLTTPPQPKTAPIRRPGARPVAPKAGTSTAGVQQNLLDKTSGASTAPRAVGEESRKAKAQEPTIRIGSADQRPDSAPKHGTADLLGRGTANDDDEVGALFAGLDDRLSPKNTPPKDAHARATRLEELGFHHSIPADAPTAPARPTETAGAKPTEVMDARPAAPADAPSAPQLDDILARLDRVLGDDPATPSAPAAAAPEPAAPAASAPATPPPPKAPSWARADVTDEDLDAPVKTDDEGRQLGLFDREKTDPGGKPG